MIITTLDKIVLCTITKSHTYIITMSTSITLITIILHHKTQYHSKILGISIQQNTTATSHHPSSQKPQPSSFTTDISLSPQPLSPPLSPTLYTYPQHHIIFIKHINSPIIHPAFQYLPTQPTIKTPQNHHSPPNPLYPLTIDLMWLQLGDDLLVNFNNGLFSLGVSFKHQFSGYGTFGGRICVFYRHLVELWVGMVHHENIKN